MSVKIIVDSTIDLAPEISDKFDFVPLTVHFGNEEFLDGVTISRRMFYEKLIECNTVPTTSQATPASFSAAYKKAFAEGFDEIVVLTISSTLSGTFQSAVIAAAEYPDNIYVIDTHNVSIGSGILAEYAFNLLQQGYTGKAIKSCIEEKRDDVCIVALLDTLEYLKRGGRISKATALAGTLLSIKPVIAVNQGKIQILGKARGSKQANNLLVSEIRKAGSVEYNMPILLGYTGLNDDLLQKYVKDNRTLWEGHINHLSSTCIGSVVGTHAGPGGVAAAFFKRKKELNI